MAVETSQFDEDQVSRIIGILREERQVLVLTPFQKRVFTLLRNSVYGIIINILLIFLAYWFWEKSLPSFIDISLVLLAALFFFCILISLLLSFPLIRKMWKQRRLWQRLGLQRTLEMQGLNRSGFKIVGDILGVVFGILGAVAAILFSLGFLIMSREGKLTTGSAFVIANFISLGIAFFAMPFLRIGKERLDLFDEMKNLEKVLFQSRLQAQKDGAEVIEIAAADVGRLAEIEQIYIARDRAQAIDSFQKEDTADYNVLKSIESSKAIADLNLETRLRVEEGIQQLTEDPHPQEAGKDQSGNYWRLPVPDTAVQILYTVDESQRQVKIILLQTSSDEAPANGTGEGRHA